MITSIRSIGCLLLGCACLLVFNACALQNVHYKSLLELREETATNYSQQVVDAIVGVREKAALPVFFTVEAGQSSFSPSIAGGIAAVLTPRWNADRTTLQPSLNGSVSMSNAIQYNDFGSAPMSRINTLYAIMCFQYDVGNTTLPNGVMYTVVSEQDSAKGLQYARKTDSGTYIGVPKEKQEDFLKFSKDVNYWSRHAAPDLNDLNSTAGMVYRFAIEYSQILVDLSKALKTRDGATAGLPAAQQALAAEKAAYDKLVAEAKTSKTNPGVMTTLLQFEREELQSKAQGVGAVGGQIAQAKQTIATDMSKLDGILRYLKDTLVKVKKYDPDASGIDVDATIDILNKQISQVIAGDAELVKKFETSALGGALKAEDSVDKLYRDRFESLPGRFNDNTFQSVE